MPHPPEQVHSGAAPSLSGAVPGWVPCAPLPDAGAATIDGLVSALLAQHSQLLRVINCQAAMLQSIAEQQGDAMQGAAATLRAAIAAAPEAALELGIAGPAAELALAAAQQQQQQRPDTALDPAWLTREPSSNEVTELFGSGYWD